MLYKDKTELNRFRALKNGDYVSPDEQIVQRLSQLIEDNFRKQRRRMYYSDEIGVNIHRLDELTRFHLKMTVNGLIRDRAHQEAKRLLKDTLLSVKQICYEVGENDPPYFCRQFKQKESVSPRTWRKKNAVNN